MKKRRIVIASFLIIATLVTSIGFATVNGALNISGFSTFNGSSVTQDTINTAMKFKENSAVAIQNCSASITSNDIADITVNINDDGSTAADDLFASAKYTVIYDAPTNQSLQNVKLNAPTCTATYYLNGVQDPSIASNFVVTTEWSNESEGCTINSDGTAIIVPGGTIEVTVTVKFIHPTEKVTGTEKANVTVGLTYTSVNE